MSTGLASSERYRVERELGSGAMGRVYLVHDTKHGRKVALKTLHPDVAASVGAERFLREIQIAAQLNHPHILPLHDSGEVNGTLFYVMPFASGETLRERLTRERRLPVADALEIVREVADAMDHAHRHGVVHRDLKPENILLHEGHALVADFGIARALEVTDPVHMTQTGMSLGTPAYMSPEQAAGDPAVDGRSDIYSLACVMYEALVGEPPFTGASAAAVIAKRFTHDAPPLRERRPDAGDAVSAAVARALSREPGDRFATAREFATALTRAATSGVATPEPRPNRSIVVLPFANLSSDPENEYFSDGLTEELIADLSRVRALRVISRTSSMKYKGSGKDAREIGRELDVRYVLEGSVRKAGSSVRITAQLIDAAADSQLWAEKYSGTADDIFALQERVSRDIVSGLDVVLSPSEEKAIVARAIADPTAYDCYLRARHEFHLVSPGSLDRAGVLARRGMEIVGDNALFRALLGQVDAFRVRMGHSSDPSLLESAEAHAKAAIAMAPDAPAGYALLGMLEFERGRTQEAVRLLKRALDADPADVDALFLLGIVYLYPGRTDDARSAARRLAAIDPLSPFPPMILSVANWFDGRFEEGVPLMAHSLELTGESTVQRWQWGYLLALLGRVDDAADQAERLSRTDPHNPYTRQLVSLVHALRGERARAVEEIAGLDMNRLDHHTSFHVGECYAVAGDAARAMVWLESGVDKGFHPPEFIARHDPLLASLRHMPEFQALAEKARRKSDAFEP